MTLVWGLTFPLLRLALREVAPLQFVAARFCAATLAFLPIVFLRARARRALRAVLWSGLWLGALSYLCYLAQTIGLQTVPAGRAAFLTGLNVILVPVLAPLFRAGRPSRLDIAGAALATVGMFVLTQPQQPGAAGRLQTGDLWILSCAVTFAVYIHLLQRTLRRGPDVDALAFLQVLGVGLCALAPVLTGRSDHWRPPGSWSAALWVAVLVCAVPATVGTFWLQTRYQGQTTPQRAALIFALEPVFATAFAFAILRETLTARQTLGAAIILAAILLVELWRTSPAAPSAAQAAADAGRPAR